MSEVGNMKTFCDGKRHHSYRNNASLYVYSLILVAFENKIFFHTYKIHLRILNNIPRRLTRQSVLVT